MSMVGTVPPAGAEARADAAAPAVEAGRRDFLVQLGCSACALAGLGVAKGVVDYLEPGEVADASSEVIVGPRERIREGTVLFVRDGRVFVVGTADGMYAMSAVCPHLGCVTRLQSETTLIDCACHGSAFTLAGEPLSGPSPPLRWLEVRLNDRNEVVVDTRREVPAGRVFRG
jgi:Rieske Fe-S protein